MANLYENMIKHNQEERAREVKLRTDKTLQKDNRDEQKATVPKGRMGE
jgi:hypothetical protein